MARELESDGVKRGSEEDRPDRSTLGPPSGVDTLFRAIVANTTDAVFVKDLEGRYVYINEAGARFLGRSIDDVIGRDDTELFSPETSGEIMLGDRRVIEGGRTVTYEDRGTAAGATRVYLSTKGVVRDERGEVVGLFGISRDITERELAQEALARSEHLASLGVMAAGIAHEINNPLASILIAARSANEELREGRNDALERSLESIIRNTDRCREIVRSVLRFSRREPTEKRRADFNEIVRIALDQVRSYAASRTVTLREHLAPIVLPVYVNPIEIEQVVVNLVRNGIEAGDRDVTVSIGTAWVGGRVRLRVRDNGCGMTEEQKRHLYDPFYSTRRAQGGTGLGMSLIHAIVTSHDGTIDVKSLPGWGSEITISLPSAGGTDGAAADDERRSI